MNWVTYHWRRSRPNCSSNGRKLRYHRDHQLALLRVAERLHQRPISAKPRSTGLPIRHTSSTPARVVSLPQNTGEETQEVTPEASPRSPYASPPRATLQQNGTSSQPSTSQGGPKQIAEVAKPSCQTHLRNGHLGMASDTERNSRVAHLIFIQCLTIECHSGWGRLFWSVSSTQLSPAR
jgi:hypothetical protein